MEGIKNSNISPFDQIKILKLKLKVGPNEYKTFNLNIYDDLFISLENFFEINKIRKDLIKPIILKIFYSLNKIFYLMNNRIGLYDREYLNSLYRLWKKNNEQIPKRNIIKEEEKIINVSNNSRNKRRILNNYESKLNSSDSSYEDNKKSNSFRMNNSDYNDKEDSINSI